VAQRCARLVEALPQHICTGSSCGTNVRGRVAAARQQAVCYRIGCNTIRIPRCKGRTSTACKARGHRADPTTPC